jgi:mono/diheme cytochrome c family protein
VSVRLLAAAVAVASLPLARAGEALAQGSRAPAGLSFQTYREQVEPIFLKPRAGHGPGLSPCVTCHAHSATAFKLELPEEGASGRVAWSIEQSRKNFERAARLVVPGRPEESRLVMEALGSEAGSAAYHAGGIYWRSRDDPEWRALADWVRAAAPAAAAVAAPPALDTQFFRTCVQKVFLRKRPGLARCADCHDLAPRNFAPPLRPGEEIWSEEQSRINLEVLRRFITPGDPAASRFLMHPLEHEAGGDSYHAGGRHWKSQEDPEWQMLAAWVRGETPQCVVEGAAARGAGDGR